MCTKWRTSCLRGAQNTAGIPTCSTDLPLSLYTVTSGLADWGGDRKEKQRKIRINCTVFFLIQKLQCHLWNVHNKFIILNLKLLQYEQRSLVYHVSSCYERVPRRDGLRLFSSFSLFPFTSHEGKRDRTCAVAPFNFNPLGDKRVKNKKGGVCVGVDTF